MAKTSFVVALALLMFFFSLAVASARHHRPGPYNHAPKSARLSVVRKLWSHFAFSSAGAKEAGDSSSPMEVYRRSSRNGKTIEMNRIHRPIKVQDSRDHENAWWSSSAVSAPVAGPGPVIALDPTSLAVVDGDDKQRTLRNPDGDQLGDDYPDAVPASAEVEAPMQAVQPISPVKPFSSKPQPAMKAHPIELEGSNAVGRFAPGYGGFKAASGGAVSEPIWASLGFNQETAKPVLSTAQPTIKPRSFEHEASSAVDEFVGEHDAIEGAISGAGVVPAVAEISRHRP